MLRDHIVGTTDTKRTVRLTYIETGPRNSRANLALETDLGKEGNACKQDETGSLKPSPSPKDLLGKSSCPHSLTAGLTVQRRLMTELGVHGAMVNTPSLKPSSPLV